MSCRKGTRGGNALLCFVLGFVVSCVCGGRIACFFGGIQSESDDVASEKSGPAEGVGSCCVLGRQPSSILIFTSILIANLESEIRIDPGLSNEQS